MYESCMRYLIIYLLFCSTTSLTIFDIQYVPPYQTHPSLPGFSCRAQGPHPRKTCQRPSTVANSLILHRFGSLSLMGEAHGRFCLAVCLRSSSVSLPQSISMLVRQEKPPSGGGSISANGLESLSSRLSWSFTALESSGSPPDGCAKNSTHLQSPMIQTQPPCPLSHSTRVQWHPVEQ